MRTRWAVISACAVLLAAGPALADWDWGDPNKMHYPQMPDPDGWDVAFNCPNILADDWGCTETGWVTDIHFWMSSRDDHEFVLDRVHASIHENLPPDASIQWSRPGAELWAADFDPTQFTVRHWDTGLQGWFDPNDGTYIEDNHYDIWQVNIVDIPDPCFWQEEGEIYWLDLCVDAKDPMDPDANVQVGWKTSLDHFEDDAVFWDEYQGIGEWVPLEDPLPPYESLDMAFVITPEPATACLLVLGGAALMARRRRRSRA
jgi:hypothetical protein